jgi:anthranilate phosphoribosyltransferase
VIKALQQVLRGTSLNSATSEIAMSDVLERRALPEQVGAFLAAMQFRAPTAAEIVGFVRALRQRALPVPLSPELASGLIDVCGTGGDGGGTFNISTACAFVVAAGGVKVAKHGNRAVSSRAGSFDVLEALGVPFCDTANETERSLELHGLAFLYAPSFQPALRELGALRRALGVRTVFNVLGPLLNPASVRRQVIGVYSAELLLPVAEALLELGATHAFVVHGECGGDELSICAPTRVAQLANGRITQFRIDPVALGIASSGSTPLKGGSAAENALLLENVLRGEIGPRRNAVALNAAAAFIVGGRAESISEGLLLAERELTSGRAHALLEKMR